VVIASLVALASLLDLIGFQIAMALFLLLHLRWVGRRGWLFNVGLALAGSVGTFVLFDRVLQVPLPLSSLPLLSDWGL
jgi:putative tricarboxylic transport membrane protein